MAVNPVQFLVASNASITNGTKTITVSGNVDCSRVFSGTAVFLGGADNPAEAISGTAPNGSGVSTITLRNNWSQGDVINQQLISFNTNEGLAEAISNVREIVSNVSAIEDLTTQGLIKRIDDNTYEVVNITAIGESLITASDASSQRSVLGLGGAATKEVATDSLLGETTKLMYVGHAGIGALGHSIPDWNTEVKAGFWAGTGAGSTNYPSPFTSFYGWIEMNRASNQENRARIQVFNEVDGTLRIPVASTDDRGTTWHTDELVTKSSMTGWGDIDVPPYPNSNFNTLTNVVSGIYGGFGSVSTANGAPFSASSCNYILKVIFERDGSCEQILHFTRKDSNRVNETYIRNSYTNTWTPWVNFYHSGNSVNPLDYGLGQATTSASLITDFGLNEQSGFYRSLGGYADAPESSTFNSSVIASPASTGTNFLYQRNVSGSSDIKAWLGCTRPQSGDVAWAEIYHSGNTNFNEFYTPSGNLLVSGYGRNASLADFNLPLNSNVSPTGITAAGTFRIIDLVTDNTVLTGATPTFVTASTSKTLVVRFSGSFTSGRNYLAVAESGGATITVNY